MAGFLYDTCNVDGSFAGHRCRNAGYRENPGGAKIKRDAAQNCTPDVYKGCEYGTCIVVIEAKNQKGGDPKPFDSGVYFNAWLVMDLLARPDEPPNCDFLSQAEVAARPQAARLLKLCRDSQKQVGVTDDQTIMFTGLDDHAPIRKRLTAPAADK